MVFSSIAFLFAFLPAVLWVYYISPRRLQNLFLLGASLFFYTWGGGALVLVLIGSIAFNYLLGARIERAVDEDRGSAARRYLGLAVAGNVGVLVFFKYTSFATATLASWFEFVGIPDLPVLEILLPIGISFYTFQTMSYTIDLYRGVVEPTRNPLKVALFVKRANAARMDLPTHPFGPRPVDQGLLEADEAGRWGTDRSFGGRFVPETLMAALLELEAAYEEIRRDPTFWAQLRELLNTYVGRPTPIYRADRLAAELERRVGREPGNLRLYLKREDLDHTGAHKINNALGQAMLAKALGARRIVAETGAGQHGVASAAACAAAWASRWASTGSR